MERKKQISKLTQTAKFDLCIIGAGATGAGIALDATLRGLKVILIDKGDFSGETSSKSTKLIHGGVRYLEQAIKKLDWEQFKMVKKSLQERDILLNNAPHLTSKLALLTPCYNWLQGFYLSIGLKLYEKIAGSHTLGTSKLLSKKKSLSLIPQLNSKKLKCGVLYYDGQLDDARYCLSIIQKAEELGATVINYTKATKFNYNSTNGKLQTLEATDLTNNQTLIINANTFINATGPFADNIRKMANNKLPNRISVSRGAHIVLPKSIMPVSTAILVPKTDDGRVIFIIPWQDSVLVGTTDTPDTLKESPQIEANEIPYLIDYVNRYLNKKINFNDIKGSFAGQRPLLNKIESTNDTKSLVRDHEIEIDFTSNLVSIMGGKWTTYRLMAKDTIDHIYTTLWKQKPPQCKTQNQKLFGADNYNPDNHLTISKKYNITVEIAMHLHKKYGSKAEEVLNLSLSDNTLLEQLHPSHPFIKAQIKYSIINEMAVTAEDVLERRLGFSLRDKEAANTALIYTQQLIDQYKK